jgi:very-short-patch-repair endonuclease
MGQSTLEATLDLQLRALRITGYEREYRFDSKRLWRFDFAWPSQKLAVEVEGGIWSNGRHTRGSGFAQDCRKYNSASLTGWVVLRYTEREIKSLDAAQEIEEVLRARGILRGADHSTNAAGLRADPGR